MKYLYIYRGIATPSLAITLLISVQLLLLESFHGLIFLVWEKLISLAAVSAYVYFFKAEHIYFFMNLGVSRRAFYVAIAVVDLVFFAAAMTVVSFIK